MTKTTPKLDVTTLGQRLRLLIEGTGVSQAAFARAVPISREHLNAILHDRHVPRGHTIVRIAKALNVDRSEIERKRVA